MVYWIRHIMYLNSHHVMRSLKMLKSMPIEKVIDFVAMSWDHDNV